MYTFVIDNFPQIFKLLTLYKTSKKKKKITKCLLIYKNLFIRIGNQLINLLKKCYVSIYLYYLTIVS